MQEFMLSKKKGGIPGNAILYLDLTKGTVGSQVIYDQATKQNMTRHVLGSPSDSDGYVNHPTFGPCYYFNGGVAFTLPSALALDTMYYLVQVEVATYDATTYSVLFETGDYPSAPNAGSNFNLNNTTGAYWTLFQTTGGGTYRTVGLNGTNDLGMNKLTVQKDNTGTTMANVTKGTSQLFNNFGTLGDSFTRIGSNSAGNSVFKGWLKSLSVLKLS